MNCHFVTRALTKEWETAGGKLCYYDFLDKTLNEGFSKFLFAQPDTNSREIEALINTLVETPLFAFKPKLLSNEEINVDEWPVFRAMYLYFLIQSARFSKAQVDAAKQTDEIHKLDELLLKGTAFLDSLVLADMAHQKMVHINMPEGQIMFFPEGGFFQFPIQDTVCGISTGFAVPITPFSALARIPKSADVGNLLANRGGISGFSVGLNIINRRVLIPKIARDYLSDEKIAELMETQRTAAITAMTNVNNYRDLVDQMYATFGLVAPGRKQ